MAAEGAPIWGDTKYGLVKEHPRPVKGAHGKNRQVKERSEIGLYSTKMIFEHPVTGEEVFLHREPEGKAFEIMDQFDW